MSWITDLADKAENVLNKIDKNAATALQISDAQGIVINRCTIEDVIDNKNSIPHASAEVTIDLSRSLQQNESDTQPDKIYLRKPRLNTMSLPSSPSRLKLGDNEQELSAFKIALNELTRERNELCEQLKKTKNEQATKELLKHEEIIAEFKKERDAYKYELSNMRADNMGQKEIVNELETNYVKLQQQYREIADKFEMQLQENVRQRQEFDEYRMKAQRALHSKDLLIEELKHSGTAENIKSNDNTNEKDIPAVVVNQLQEHYQKLLEDNTNLKAKLEELQNTNLQQQEEYEKQLKSLRSALTTERELAIATASELRVLAQEITSLRQQISNLKEIHATNLQEKDKQLQRALTDKPTETMDHDNRLKTLTAVLVEKQNVLEHITAERNALRIQLEKSENQLQRNNVLVIPQDTMKNALFSNSTDDVKSQFPMLLKENPFDTRVARRVKRGFSSLDSVGIRLGTFLRRYPLMRVFVLMYVGLLHLWVMFVLLSSTPNQ